MSVGGFFILEDDLLFCCSAKIRRRGGTVLYYVIQDRLANLSQSAERLQSRRQTISGSRFFPGDDLFIGEGSQLFPARSGQKGEFSGLKIRDIDQDMGLA